MAACGIDCNACNLYRAAWDDAAAEAPVEWFRFRGWIGGNDGAETVRRRTPLCMGCWTEGDDRFCGKCSLFDCCDARGLDHCGECGEFPCAQYREWIDGLSHHEAAMELLMSMKK